MARRIAGPFFGLTETTALEAVLAVDVEHPANRAVVGADFGIGVRERVDRKRRELVGDVVDSDLDLQAIEPLAGVKVAEVIGEAQVECREGRDALESVLVVTTHANLADAGD